MSIVVRPVAEARDETLRLKHLDYGGFLRLSSIVKHQKGQMIFPTLLSRVQTFVSACEEDFLGQLLGCSLLCIEVSVLPVQPGHLYEIYLRESQPMLVEVLAHFKLVNDGAIDAENFDQTRA